MEANLHFIVQLSISYMQLVQLLDLTVPMYSHQINMTLNLWHQVRHEICRCHKIIKLKIP